MGNINPCGARRRPDRTLEMNAEETEYLTGWACPWDRGCCKVGVKDPQSLLQSEID